MAPRWISPSILALALLVASGAAAPTSESAHRLPTGATLDPDGHAVPLGSMPLAMALSPDSSRLAIVLSGHREQGVQIVDAARGTLLQTLIQPAAFLGVVFSRDGHSLYVSGGNQDVIYRYAIGSGLASLADSIRLEPTHVDTTSAGRSHAHDGVRYPAGLALSSDGRLLYVAENLSDSLAVVDLASGRVIERLAVGPYPYGVVVGPHVYVSAWGGSWIATFWPTAGARGIGVPLGVGARIEVGRHPSAMALNAAGTRLYVARASFDRIAVVDTRRQEMISEIADAPPAGPSEGSTPSALAVSRDESRLLIAEADNNAVAIVALGRKSRGAVEGSSAAAPAGRDSLLGRIPVEWYPTDVMDRGDSLWVLSGKGSGTGPNPDRKQPGAKGNRNQPRERAGTEGRSYTLDQTTGSLSRLAWPETQALAALSARVARNQGWDRPIAAGVYPPFQHVIYVIKENRTYDQVMGDLPAGDGDTSLVFFPRAVTPNHHALAERFGLFDRFFVNAEVSADGHQWSDAAYASDYVEKTVPSQYSDRGRKYDYDGLNRGVVPGDDVNAPGNGYLWDAALAAGLAVRNYGELTRQEKSGRWVANVPSMTAHTDPAFPGWDLDIPDQTRADEWLREFQAAVASGTLPALSIVDLPNDHTAGAKAKSPTPRAYAADNDLALGRIAEALSHSPFWKNTVMFVLEDDAQDGPDHVDSHRSPLLVISAYNRPGVVHRFANTSDVLATIGAILHLHALSQFDYFGRPLAGLFAATPDLTPFTKLVPSVSLEERNPEKTPGARSSSRLDLEHEDRADEDAFNRVLWAAVKGEGVPYPGTRHAPAPVVR